MDAKVSILMITYNHERFIGKAIDSVLEQQVDFPIELVVGEDFSTDRTRAILLEYQAKHPNVVRVLERPGRLGAGANWIDTFHQCKGQYVAVLEGDDFWTDPLKLKMQVEAMDAHPTWAMCFHRVRCEWDDNSYPAYFTPTDTPPAVVPFEELLGNNLIATCSAMYRGGALRQFPQGMEKLVCLDWATHLLHALTGEVGYIDRVMGHYRHHGAGLWSATDTRQKHDRLYDVFNVIRPVISASLRDREPMFQRDLRCAEVLMRDGYRDIARRYALHAVRARPTSRYAWRTLLWTSVGAINGKLRPF